MLKSIFFLFLSTALAVQANTRLTIETNIGDIPIELFDDAAPLTVANFLNYVDDGSYEDLIFQRFVENFIIQAGGFTVSDGDTFLLDNVSSKGNVLNEFGVSNTRGTLAMAKLGGDPNSASSQWFINLEDNSANLDNQNGGFAVFGKVEDFTTIDKITNSDVINLGGAFTNLPIRDLSTPGNIEPAPSDGSEVTKEHFLVINNISRVDNVPEPGTTSLILFASCAGLFFRKRA